MEMQVWTEALRLNNPLRISRSLTTEVDNVFVAITADGHTGYGEAAPGPWRGEPIGDIVDYLEMASTMLGDDPFAAQAILLRLDRNVGHNAAARSAVDMALADLTGKLVGQPLFRLLGLDADTTCELCYTIGLDKVDAMVAAAVDAATRFHALKIKLGGPDDATIVREISSAVDVQLRVDANGGWSAERTLALIDEVLEPCSIALIEQPVAADDLDGLAEVHARSPIPVIADESITDLGSLRPLIGICSGIDIKLTKCGGLSEALRLIAAARAVDMSVMIGCEVETSLSVTAAATLTCLADYADLDLHLWLAQDPYTGVTLRDGRFVLPRQPGIGAVPVRSFCRG
ncbi:dipeptide epimerase [Mycolicibacterium sp. 050232]|uniref:dipeptide epimerase n=1 Tax=Mycolicibacterium sp. 050232 TaxID=3113982 RepID=UPI002E293D86|nr:dipeptide epimerase [Mycolicibacterium sp. 050232]MED5814380.1 dipeptide epimerase [Mycolicibacterium sp. 050232]